MKYQWQYSPDGGETWEDIDDANADSYTFTADIDSDGWLYRCVVTDMTGNEVVSDSATLTVTESVEGWRKDETGWRYKNDDATYSDNGWQQIDGKWFYFGSDGYMLTDWQKIDGVWYYFGESGVRRSGWQKIDGEWYYFDEDGMMQIGWYQIGEKWYHFNDGGVMQSLWNKIGDYWYYLGTDGAMRTGWIKLDDIWYYLRYRRFDAYRMAEDLRHLLLLLCQRRNGNRALGEVRRKLVLSQGRRLNGKERNAHDKRRFIHL